MKKIAALFLLSFVFLFAKAQNSVVLDAINKKQNTITVHYFENYPFTYKDKTTGKLSGIEVDIMNEFISWVSKSKGAELKVNYVEYKDFSKFYETVKNEKGNHVMGVGSVTITDERSNEINFSAPYLANQSVLISTGSIPTLKNTNQFKSVFDTLTAVSLKNSFFEKQLMTLNPSIKIDYVQSVAEFNQKLISNKKYYGYTDLISYWTLVKEQKKLYVKIHKVASVSNQQFGFIFPKGSDLRSLADEFFESGFGFTSTKTYHSILEKYLGYEIINSVELN